MSSSDELIAELASVALRVINRRVVKRPVMTIPYGVTGGGAAAQIAGEIAHRVEPHLVNRLSSFGAANNFSP